MFISAILENLILDYFRFAVQCHQGVYIDQSSLKCYYNLVYPHWDHIIGYHPVISIFVFLLHKWMWYALNFVDILIAVLSRALYEKFKTLNQLSKDKLISTTPSSIPIKHGDEIPASGMNFKDAC